MINKNDFKFNINNGQIKENILNFKKSFLYLTWFREKTNYQYDQLKLLNKNLKSKNSPSKNFAYILSNITFSVVLFFKTYKFIFQTYFKIIQKYFKIFQKYFQNYFEMIPIYFKKYSK